MSLDLFLNDRGDDVVEWRTGFHFCQIKHLLLLAGVGFAAIAWLHRAAEGVDLRLDRLTLALGASLVVWSLALGTSRFPAEGLETLAVRLGGWCSVFHQVTEKWMMGRLTIPTRASSAAARAALRGSS